MPLAVLSPGCLGNKIRTVNPPVRGCLRSVFPAVMNEGAFSLFYSIAVLCQRQSPPLVLHALGQAKDKQFYNEEFDPGSG